MSAPRRGLGRGLGALLGDQPARVEEGAPARAESIAVAMPKEPTTGEVLRELPVAAIRPNPHQPRTHFGVDALAELERSIRELGVLVPLIVRPLGGEMFELIAGERRWRAAAAAQLERIPAIVRTVDDRASLELAVVENLQRENLDALEEAMGFSHLMEKYGFTQERLAERLGKSRPAVTNALRLLVLADPIKARVRGGAISAGHARALLAFPEAQRETVAERIVRDGLSVREVERLAAVQPSSARPSTPPRADANLAAIETRLRYRFGTAVRIAGGRGGGGRIEIRFANQADLTRLLDLLGEGAS